MTRLEEIRDRLGEISAALRGDQVSDTDAASLAEEAARLTAEAVREATNAVDQADRQG